MQPALCSVHGLQKSYMQNYSSKAAAVASTLYYSRTPCQARHCKCFRKHVTASIMIAMAMMTVMSMPFVRKSSILDSRCV